MDINDHPPQPPILTPAQLAQNDFEQKKLADKISVAPSKLTLMRAKALIRDFEAIPFDDLSPRQKQQLEESYANAGRFADAFQVNGNPMYLKIANANNSECDCKDFVTAEIEHGRPKEVTYSRYFKKRNIFRNGVQVPLYQCNQCGHFKCEVVE